MFRMAIICSLLIVANAGTASAQPGLESLWPNADGLRFAYRYHRTDLIEGVDYGGPAYLVLEGFVTTPGGEAQILLGDHPQSPAKSDRDELGLPGLLSAIWRARPDLRPAIEMRHAVHKKNGQWLPNLLHDGYFMKTAFSIQMWQDVWDHPTWTYLAGDPLPGVTFSHQLVPELADDIFLHGTVTANDAMVVTENGVYTNAVKVEYLVDFGIGAIVNDVGELLGTYHSEIRGHVHYVPEVGPVEMLEEYIPYVWADCGTEDCPPEVIQWLGQVTEIQTLSLVADPVAEAVTSWGEVKSLYR